MWAKSLLVVVSFLTLAVGVGSALLGAPVDPFGLLKTAVVSTTLVMGWAGGAHAALAYTTGTSKNLFEPLVYLASTSLLILFIASGILGFLPAPIGPMATVASLAYSQFLVILAVRSIGRTSLAKAIIVTIVAAMASILVTFMLPRILFGLPNMIEG